MPSILFIASHRLNRSPSQRYRFEQYLDFFKINGFESKLSYIISEKDDTTFYKTGSTFSKFSIIARSITKRLKDIERSEAFDIVFIQREALMIGSSFIEKKLSQSKAKLIFDFDDSIWLKDTSNANKRWEWLKSTSKTKNIIKHADLVIAGNSYLANYAEKHNKNVRVIPTTIDTDKFKRVRSYKNNDKLCIGWSGSSTTLKHFERAIPILKKIKETFGDLVYFKVMGDDSYINEELNIEGIKWTAESELEVINSFDIGIMPLPNDKWAKGKCGLKGLSYMALEIPTIMSPVGVNKEIIQDDQNGFLADTDDEWIHKLSLLIYSFERRTRLGKAGRKTVEEMYSVNAQKDKYLACFNSLLKR